MQFDIKSVISYFFLRMYILFEIEVYKYIILHVCI